MTVWAAARRAGALFCALLFVGNTLAAPAPGSIDGTFDAGELFKARSVERVFIQRDGRMLIPIQVGESEEYEPVYELVRLNTDGSLDTMAQSWQC